VTRPVSINGGRTAAARSAPTQHGAQVGELPRTSQGSPCSSSQDQSDLLSGVILGKDPSLLGRTRKMGSHMAKTQQPGLPAYAGSLSTHGVTRGSSMKVGWVTEWKICWVAVL
jgi:hypothetical protein